MKQPETVAAKLASVLAGEIVRNFGEVRLRVSGTSMMPSLLPGDLLSVQRASVSEISSGEIVLCSREERLFAHRVVARWGSPGEPLLITRGDRLNHNDPPVCSPELLGRVTSIQRGRGRGVRQVAQPCGPDYLMLRALRSSDRATYLYLRLAALWRELFPRRTKCRV